MSLITDYTSGWVSKSIDAIRNLLAEDAVLVEPNLDTYTGREAILNYVASFLESGSVDKWDITSVHAGDGFEAAEWDFDYTWEGEQASVQGASIVTLTDGKIARIEEYVKTPAS